MNTLDRGNYFMLTSKFQNMFHCSEILFWLKISPFMKIEKIQELFQTETEVH